MWISGIKRSSATIVSCDQRFKDRTLINNVDNICWISDAYPTSCFCSEEHMAFGSLGRIMVWIWQITQELALHTTLCSPLLPKQIPVAGSCIGASSSRSTPLLMGWREGAFGAQHWLRKLNVYVPNGYIYTRNMAHMWYFVGGLFEVHIKWAGWRIVEPEARYSGSRVSPMFMTLMVCVGQKLADWWVHY